MESLYIQIIRTEQDLKNNTYTFIKFVNGQRVFHRTVGLHQIIEGDEYIVKE